MKKLNFSLLALGLTASLSIQAAQSPFKGHGFNNTGVFHFTTAGAADVETSTNLQTWTKLASVSQEMTLDDVLSRQSEWRFYRAKAGSASNSPIVGFVKVIIAPGKTAILGNCFDKPLRLETPDGRLAIFGAANPTVKVSLFANGKLTPSTPDPSSGTWNPPLRAIAYRDTFSVENTGANPVTVRLSGEVRPGQVKISVPAGESLVVSPAPQFGEITQVLGIPAKDGLQIDIFNEESQSHQISTYDGLDNAWNPKPPMIKPGRAVMIKAPEALNWTKSF